MKFRRTAALSIALALVVGNSSLVMGSNALAAPTKSTVKKCTDTQLKKILQYAIDYNNSRAYFEQFLVSIELARAGFAKSLRENDRGGMAAWSDTYDEGRLAAQNTSNTNAKIAGQIKSLMQSCKSGYSVRFGQFGMLSVPKTSKTTIKFPDFVIPALYQEATEAEKAADDTAAALAAAVAAVADKAAADKAAAAGITCPVNGKCKIGNKGPGGGIVFYVAPTPQSWGQYLEVAPSKWSGSFDDPRISWCDVEVQLSQVVIEAQVKNLFGLGSGKLATRVMTAFCKSGAANLASDYRGGGKSDWYLPSAVELEYLAETFRGGTADLATDSYYWSSSENSRAVAYGVSFPGGTVFGFYKASSYYVRPVRAFS